MILFFIVSFLPRPFRGVVQEGQILCLLPDEWLHAVSSGLSCLHTSKKRMDLPCMGIQSRPAFLYKVRHVVWKTRMEFVTSAPWPTRIEPIIFGCPPAAVPAPAGYSARLLWHLPFRIARKKQGREVLHCFLYKPVRIPAHPRGEDREMNSLLLFLCRREIGQGHQADPSDHVAQGDQKKVVEPAPDG